MGWNYFYTTTVINDKLIFKGHCYTLKHPDHPHFFVREFDEPSVKYS